MDPDDEGLGTAAFLAVMLDPLAVAFLVACCLLKGLEVVAMDPDDAGLGTAAFLLVACWRSS